MGPPNLPSGANMSTFLGSFHVFYGTFFRSWFLWCILVSFWLTFGTLLVPLAKCFMIFEEFCHLLPASKGVGGRPDVTMYPKSTKCHQNGTQNRSSGAKRLHFPSSRACLFLLLILGCILVALWLTFGTFLVPIGFFCFAFGIFSMFFMLLASPLKRTLQNLAPTRRWH